MSLSFAEHEGELGYCVLCDTKIMNRIDNYLIPNNEYTEIWFEFSNNSIGKVGFCKKHTLNLTETDYSKVIEGIKRGWEKEFIIKKWNEEQIKKYKDTFFILTIIRRIDEKEIFTNN